ncbi:MAG: alpha/beta fold hydrolase [Nocardioides sp.]
MTDQPVITPDCTAVPAVGGQAQETLARQVLDEIDSDELDVVGHSFGGQIAIEMALAEPDRLRSLTIL